MKARNLTDGLSLPRRTAEFRSRLKDALMVVVCRGFGRMLHTVGSAWDRAPDDPVHEPNRAFLPSMEGVS